MTKPSWKLPTDCNYGINYRKRISPTGADIVPGVYNPLPLAPADWSLLTGYCLPTLVGTLTMRNLGYQDAESWYNQWIAK